ncbi:MAG: response regulator, partial [Deltaproteobacteria bacterium]|nr:response regulator [Deltaproteobacteria bacterium]
EDFRKILGPSQHDSGLDDLEAELFGEAGEAKNDSAFELESAFQGQEALELVRKANREGRPFSVAFVDMRMPPGWNGVETVSRLWDEDPFLQVVICSAYSDYSWSEVTAKLQSTDGLLILKKPFDSIEVTQIAHALSRKWALQRAAQARQTDLEGLVRARTHELEKANEALRGEMGRREKVELELRLAQKLESVGRMAAGVAHEINTPVQFVGDSVHFLRDAMKDLVPLIDRYRQLETAVTEGTASPELALDIANQREQVDVDYLVENVPKALDRSLEGLERVSTIVRSMKEFAHPGQKEMSEVDLNQSIRTTLTMARNEYKYVADVETKLEDIPRVVCHGGEINQVVLNLVVNAAHAIGDKVKGTDGKGRIEVATRAVGPDVVISIADTGGGIPEDIQGKIFDPFFTTKAVGKGTGQGLAIARTVVAEKHGGSLTFETQPGQGTTFFVRIPIGGKTAAA